MKNRILRCSKCFSYTLKEVCDNCRLKTNSTKPARFSPLDKYGKYRREYKLNN
ncbi:RNA-protein complex protein Nop10 [Candidatus Woesearchaeota archaeon]|nr:RNA-protein complex protein Nop10 [Candidatus Woesearchaeota archaeon]